MTGRALALAALLASVAAPAMAQETALRAMRRGAAPVELRVAATDAAWRIRVLEAGGRERQRIEVESDARGTPPHLADSDGDGAADLWVPVMTGNANTEYEIWRLLPAEGRFRLAGTVSGYGFRRDPTGYLVAMGRNGCCAAAYEFYRPAADGTLSLAFTIGTRFRENGGVEDCEVTAEAGKPPAEVQRRWCAVGADSPRPGERL